MSCTGLNKICLMGPWSGESIKSLVASSTKVFTSLHPFPKVLQLIPAWDALLSVCSLLPDPGGGWISHDIKYVTHVSMVICSEKRDEWLNQLDVAIYLLTWSIYAKEWYLKARLHRLKPNNILEEALHNPVKLCFPGCLFFCLPLFNLSTTSFP